MYHLIYKSSSDGLNTLFEALTAVLAQDWADPFHLPNHFIGLSLELQLGLILYCISAVIAGIWDWKVRGAPFKTFSFGLIGGIMIDIYTLSTASSFMAEEIFGLIILIQLICIGVTGYLIYYFHLGGNDDAIWLAIIALIPIGAGVIVFIAMILTVAHILYRKVKHFTDNPYKDRYPHHYPLPFCTYLGVAVLVYVGYILATGLL